MCLKGKVREYSDGRAQAENSSARLKCAGFRALNWPMAFDRNENSKESKPRHRNLHQNGASTSAIRSIMMRTAHATIASA
jgi:hypothetical protein